MERLADAVPAEDGHAAIAVRLDKVLDHGADPIVALAGSAVVNGGLPAVVGHLDELLARIIHLTHQETAARSEMRQSSRESAN